MKLYENIVYNKYFYLSNTYSTYTYISVFVFTSQIYINIYILKFDNYNSLKQLRK